MPTRVIAALPGLKEMFDPALAPLIALVTVVAAAHAAAAEVDRPNVVLILADDLGYGDLGCYGHPKFRTPHLDRLASQGARFTQFNTPAPFCAPTRASLLTGMYPVHCGLTMNPTPDGRPAADALALAADQVLLPAYLKRAGYSTAMIGKWHLGHRHVEQWPISRGFDEYLGILYSNDMRPVQLVDGRQVVEYPLVQATLTERYTKRALEFIERRRQQPFFLYIAHAMPHKPLACSEKFYKQSGAGLYGDALAELDDSVGQVLAKLVDVGIDDRTMVIFTSDNGPWCGGSSGGLRGMKGTSWEGGFRVPCLVRWPGKVAAGRVVDEPAVMMDLFETVWEGAGLTEQRARATDGRSLWPWLAVNASAETPPLHEFILGQHGGQLATIRDRRWKLHVVAQDDPPVHSPGERWIDPRGPDGVTILAPYEQATRDQYPGLRTGDATPAMSLFDLTSDPAEQHNVAAQHPDEVSRLKALFDRASRELARVER
ncbi:MAG: sulfatase-like hydrolase/transferase [Pirellulales bacterium]|nr:sulfatase-like hydrolase/transferase [Pirellulales bacterium]